MSAFEENRANRLLDWAASLLFAVLVGYACHIVGGAKFAVLGTAAGFMIGAGTLAKIGAHQVALAAFDVVPFEPGIEKATVESDELLLDDPIASPEAGSRVVALFGQADRSPAALVARIEDYLGRESDRSPPGRMNGMEEAGRPMVDASAALHAALSNIRASLR